MAADETIDLILKCIIYTEVCIIGSFTMFSYQWSIESGFVIWGAIVAFMLAGVFWCGGLFGEDKEPNMLFVVAIMNVIGVNFGGYLVLMLMLHMPIAGVTYVRQMLIS